MERLQISITMGAERGGAGPDLILLDGLSSARQETDEGALAGRGLDDAAPQTALQTQSVTKIASDLTALQLTGVLCRNSCGSPIAWPSQSITRDSSSVQAGELAQVKPRQLIPSASMSPSREG